MDERNIFYLQVETWSKRLIWLHSCSSAERVVIADIDRTYIHVLLYMNAHGTSHITVSCTLHLLSWSWLMCRDVFFLLLGDDVCGVCTPIML